MNNRYRSKCRTVKGPKFNNIEIWNLRDILSRHIYKGLVQFKKAKRCGYPGTVTIDEWDEKKEKARCIEPGGRNSRAAGAYLP